MSTLISSATCASNILFYGVTTCSASTTGLPITPNVKIGLVPFTMEVNVGTANASAAWLDRTGTNAGAASGDNIANDNFDNDDDTTTTNPGPIDRVALFSQLKDYRSNTMTWGGCVEARREPYDTDDTTPVSTNLDTLFTPFFAPDEPGVSAQAGYGTTSNGDTFYNSYLPDSPHSCDQTIGCSWQQVET